ncbi:MAG: SH3 domain-containing protein [Gammaproteobacteria bacterium]|nr:SH3 domain-containing protein [Gammaproteobacteria bacterium]NIR85607.1 SH3 domain-containing protein [Gammaproteobacteria bacterium]NIR90048.1 SH3 domain-containing protein [Gammaproteobacteria bacterium]NIU06736.1 SH3 domain-containing protein [Gammaproteobacteria bacterium]NIV53667.1 SH3 domain-containing protein [Gammaproteobacteria bacterium]
MSTGTVIARGGLNLRKSPKTGKVIKALRRGANVEVVEEETWYRVKTRDGEEGYVLADFVELSPETLFTPPVTGAAEEAEAEAAAPSDVCDIRRYRNDRFIGEELRADLDFFSCLDRLNQFAGESDVEIFVTSSTREPERKVSGAIVPPASRSNHLVGHAVDMNLRSRNGFFNSGDLKRGNLPRLPAEIREFIEKIRQDPELRWGGDFTREDPVHIDDALNHRDRARWDSKLASRR